LHVVQRLEPLWIVQVFEPQHVNVGLGDDKEDTRSLTPFIVAVNHQ
jgi:hypothetical protein